MHTDGVRVTRIFGTRLSAPTVRKLLQLAFGSGKIVSLAASCSLNDRPQLGAGEGRAFAWSQIFAGVRILKSVSNTFVSPFRMDLIRTIVIGNSGSGKSWLAERVADRSGAAYVDLDLIHWLPGGYGVPRERADAIRLAQLAAEADRWVIEGIYGWLVNEVLANASALVWLCIDEGECVANIRRRGIRRNGSPEAFDALVEWAATYRSRTGSSSYGAHRTIFEQFHGDKETLGSRDAIGEFVGRVAPLRMSNP
ncbi:hypothetical protein [Burkholderia diffusa]|uniref:hypothetical protein n=1 Tax=Burkholderia diffusa TaxID=488732 RepID=UPI000AB32E89|nr:hypothetical protein [Burkholderia diffusa]